MKDNTYNCRLILSTGYSNQIQTGNSLIRYSLCEKLLVVKFDQKLIFDHPIHMWDQRKRNCKWIPFLLHNSVIVR